MHIDKEDMKKVNKIIIKIPAICIKIKGCKIIIIIFSIENNNLNITMKWRKKIITTMMKI